MGQQYFKIYAPIIQCQTLGDVMVIPTIKFSNISTIFYCRTSREVMVIPVIQFYYQCQTLRDVTVIPVIKTWIIPMMNLSLRCQTLRGLKVIPVLKLFIGYWILVGVMMIRNNTRSITSNTRSTTRKSATSNTISYPRSNTVIRNNTRSTISSHLLLLERLVYIVPTIHTKISHLLHKLL